MFLLFSQILDFVLGVFTFEIILTIGGVLGILFIETDRTSLKTPSRDIRCDVE